MVGPTIDIGAIVNSALSVSDKIRRLAAAGYSRRQIADLVGRSYQQVRQVLVEDERRAGLRSTAQHTPAARPASDPSSGGVAEPGVKFGGIYRLDVEDGGVVRLPPAVQTVLGASPGGVLIAELADDRLIVLSTEAAWRQVKDLVRSFGIDPERRLSDELIAERRLEAAREDAGG
jgi:hypothetical protein